MRKFMLPVLLLAGCGSVQAADNGFYLGGSLGQSSIQLTEQALKFDGTDTAWKLIAGLRPLDWLGVEANYVDFGSPDDSVGGNRIKSEGTGISAFAVGFLPVGPVDVMAKAGLVKWDASLSAPALPGVSLDDSGTDLAYGAGVQFRLLSLSIRGEYEVFKIEELDDVKLFSIGLTWTFL
jgi:hypothetical protein